MIQLPHHRWRPANARGLLWTAGLAVALAFGFVVICGYLFGLKWTGFADQTLWDWLKLLLAAAVPVVIAYLGTRISTLQYLGQQDAEKKRAQDEALQAYLDQMSQLLLTEDEEGKSLRDAKQGDIQSTVARARTLTVL